MQHTGFFISCLLELRLRMFRERKRACCCFECRTPREHVRFFRCRTVGKVLAASSVVWSDEWKRGEMLVTKVIDCTRVCGRFMSSSKSCLDGATWLRSQTLNGDLQFRVLIIISIRRCRIPGLICCQIICIVSKSKRRPKKDFDINTTVFLELRRLYSLFKERVQQVFSLSDRNA